jgi:sortase A
MNERARRRFGRGLLICGVGLLAVWLGLTLDGRAYQAMLAHRLESIVRSPHGRSSHGGAQTARVEAIASGLIGRIEIPRVGISAIVIEGTGGRVLRRGVGHIERSAFPGEPGNVALAAHRDTYFRDLKDVAVGDLIRITTPDGAYAYRVDSILVVTPDRGDLLDDAGRPELTLVTCYPFYWVGPAPKRFVVRASQTRPGRAARLG